MYPSPLNDRSTQLRQKRLRALGCIAAVCIAAFLLGVVAVKIYRSLDVSRWPTVSGTITKVRIEEDKHRLFIFARCDAKVTFAYSVNGEKFVGKNIMLTPISAKFESQLNWVKEQYPVGSRQKVYYQASDPSIACLRYAPMIGDIIAVAITFSLIVAGLWDLIDLAKE